MRLHHLALVVAVLGACHGATGSYKAADSMLPTIAVGAQIAVSDLARDPVRGRVIVFRSPEKPDKEYVKRIVGVAGDTIATHGPEIVLNGEPIHRCRVGPWKYEEAGAKAHQGEIWLEEVEGARWLVFHEPVGRDVASAGPWTVAPGEVFVLGDNRENSHDSRVWFGGKGGGLPLRFIVGSAMVAAAPTLPKGAESLQPALDECEATLPRSGRDSTASPQVGPDSRPAAIDPSKGTRASASP
jgi:signal peptidase I